MGLGGDAHKLYSSAMDSLKAQIAGAPKLAQMIGQALFSLGGFMIICGLIGRVATTALNSTRGLSKLPPIAGLKEAYPNGILWWVPEHFFGYVLPVLIAALGIYVADTAKGMLKSQSRAKRHR